MKIAVYKGYTDLRLCVDNGLSYFRKGIIRCIATKIVATITTHFAVFRYAFRPLLGAKSIEPS